MDTNAILNQEQQIEKRHKSQAKRAITLSFLACTLLQVSQIVLSFFYTPTENEIFYLVQNIIIYVLSFLIPFGVLALFFSFLNKEKTKQIKRYLPRKPVLYICGTVGVGYIVIFTANILLGDLVEKLTLGDPFIPKTMGGILLFYVYQALLPAIIEEWAFRGLILKNLLPYGRKGAILISAILFGIVHVQPVQACFATVLGILIAIVYEYTGSLLVPIIIHFINNAISATITIFQDNLAVQTVFSLAIMCFIGCAIGFIISFSKNGINTKPISLIESNSNEYKLTVGKYLQNFILNPGIIPFLLIISFLVYLYYFV